MDLRTLFLRPTKAADEITKEEYIEGRKELKQKIQTFRPKVVCFVGKGVYQQFSQKRDLPWGVQVKVSFQIRLNLWLLLQVDWLE